MSASSAPGRAADEALIAAAKKEGEVVWYTTQILDPLVLRLQDAFRRKYGIEIKPVRQNSTELAIRVSNEAKAGRVQADVYDGTTTAEVLKKEGLALKWLPEIAKELPKDYVDPDGYWIGTNYYLITAAFNTDLVKPGTEPKHWDDLLDPRFKGQIVWGNTVSISAGPGFIGIVLKDLGEQKGMDYLRKLAQQKIAGVGASARVVIDQAIAGEYAIALQIFPEHAAGSGAKGAPIKWIPMKPAMSAIVSTTGVIANSPHPNAGKLLLDYLVNEEGQTIYRDAEYAPAQPRILSKDPEFRQGAHRTVFLTPPEAMEELPKWVKVFKDLF
jgi:iron(III) transport system substrate-binding protein